MKIGQALADSEPLDLHHPTSYVAVEPAQAPSFSLTFENLTRGFLRSPSILRSLHTKALDPECLDRHVRRPRCDELGHDGAGSGAKLEPVRREAELVERPFRRGAPSEHGMSSGILASSPAQARRIVVPRMTGKSSQTVFALSASLVQSSTVTFWSRTGRPR